MPKLANKHVNAALVQLNDFTGGLNLSRPTETISDSEMQEAVNFEFAPDSGILRVRGGLLPAHTFTKPVRDIIPISGGNAALVRSGDGMYKLADGVATFVGSVDGNSPASYEFWGDEGTVIMAFGGRLHIFDGASLEAVDAEDAPDRVETVFNRFGRISVAESDSDNLRSSGVGDPRRWTTGNAADALSLEVGYKDGCGISAIAELAGEMLVFKRPSGQPEHGRIYRVQGNPGDETVVPYSRGSAAWNPQAVVNVANDLLFITKEGVANLATVAAYGDFRQEWAGAKINTKLSPALADTCRLWHIPLRGQIWVWDGHSAQVWCYHYQVGEGAWTKLAFPGVVQAVSSIRGQTHIGIGNTVYVMNEANLTDTVIVRNSETGESESMGVDIEARWKPRTILRRNQILIKGLIVRYHSSFSAEAVAKIDAYRLKLPPSKHGDFAATDSDVAYLDDDPLIAEMSSDARARCNIRRWDITPEIIVKNGQFSMSSVNLELAEV